MLPEDGHAPGHAVGLNPSGDILGAPYSWKPVTGLGEAVASAGAPLEGLPSV